MTGVQSKEVGVVKALCKELSHCVDFHSGQVIQLDAHTYVHT